MKLLLRVVFIISLVVMAYAIKPQKKDTESVKKTDETTGGSGSTGKGGSGSTGKGGTATAKLEATLENAGRPNVVNFTVTNVGEETVHILRWDTPLENMFTGDFFKLDGKKKSAFGVSISRSLEAVDPKADVATLKKGESASGEVDLQSAYHLKPGTTTKIEPVFVLSQVKPAEVNKSPLPQFKTYETVGKVTFSSVSLNITIEPSEDAVVASTKGKPKDKDTQKNRVAFIATRQQSRARAWNYASCDGVKGVVDTAIADAKTKIKAALDYIKHDCPGDKLFSDLFGTNSRATVNTTFKNAKTLAEGSGIHVDCTNRTDWNADNSWKNTKSLRLDWHGTPYDLTADCKGATNAYVYRECTPPTIFLCPLWYSYHATTGEWNRAGILVHELTHFNSHSGGVDIVDVNLNDGMGTRYGKVLAKDLSTHAESITNAENHMIFADEAPAACPASTP